MNRLRLSGRLVLLALVLVAGPVAAQSRTAIPLLPGTPDLVGPIFADGHAIAALGGGAIQVVTGLEDPATAFHFVVTPP